MTIYLRDLYGRASSDTSRSVSPPATSKSGQDNEAGTSNLPVPLEDLAPAPSHPSREQLLGGGDRIRMASIASATTEPGQNRASIMSRMPSSRSQRLSVYDSLNGVPQQDLRSTAPHSLAKSSLSGITQPRGPTRRDEQGDFYYMPGLMTDDMHQTYHSTSASAPEPMQADDADKSTFRQHSVQQQARLGSKLKKYKWQLAIFGAVVLSCIVIAATVGTIMAARKHDANSLPSSSSPTPTLITPTASPSAINAGLPGSDLQVDTPLVPVAFTANTSNNGQSSGTQNYELWYQNVCGNVKGAQCAADWASYGTAFTDAANVSGMTGFTFYNNSLASTQTYLIYVAYDGQLRDKKLNPADNTFEIASLASQHLAVLPASADAVSSAGNASSAWDGYALASVWSDNAVPQGPGARLVFHAIDNTSDNNYLQEATWAQHTDTWTLGTRIGLGVVDPVSHLSMVVDSVNAVVRLMFAVKPTTSPPSPGSIGLQEYYLPLAPSSNGTWQRGQLFSNMLQHPSSAFALAATDGNAFLYHVRPLNGTGPQLLIEELPLPAANATTPLDTTAAQTVAVPDWLSKDTGGRVETLYAPVAAVGAPGMLNVFYAEGVTDAKAGYARLVQVQRELGKAWLPVVGGKADGQVSLPLDGDCVPPDV